MSDNTSGSVAMIGSYVPRKCGIATFTFDLSCGLAESVYNRPLAGGGPIGVVALNDLDEKYDYAGEVVFELRDHAKEAYREAADFLNQSKFEVVCVQHEYGIYGGDCGDYLLALTDRLTKPVVTTLHTVLADPNPSQKRVLKALADRSSALVVMAHRAYRMLEDVYGVPPSKTHLVHHGVPDVPFGDTEPFKGRFEVAGRPTILTFGLLSPGKGIEMMLDALAKVKPDFPNIAYIVLGATHPGVRRESGEAYRISLEQRAIRLGIAENVIFHNRYVSLDDLCEYLRAADLYVTPYRNRDQIVSGTLAYALATGRAIISTPYWYAEELLDNGRGRLVGFEDVDALANQVRELLRDDNARLKVRKAAYEFGRRMTWSSVANQYRNLFDKAREDRKTLSADAMTAPTKMRLSLPEVRIDHLYRMTDDTGLLQHAIHGTPNRHHGYSIDDQTRGMIVSAMYHRLFRDRNVLGPFHTYLSYVHYAKREDGFFRNFMSFDRRWLEDEGDNSDAQGRVMWATGYSVTHPPDRQSRMLCRKLFLGCVPLFDDIHHVRSLSFAILGCHYFLRHESDTTQVERLMRLAADRIMQQYTEHEGDNWPWYEDVVTYANARVPQSLVLAGLQFGDTDMIARGVRMLDWLLEVQTGREGYLSLIGNRGWLSRGSDRAEYDQQAIEVAALVGACKAAYRATGNVRYLNEMRRCFDWYLGANDQHVQVIDFATHGCHDGLTPDGVNLNQGAESLLAWLLSLLTMHEMQTGEPITAG